MMKHTWQKHAQLTKNWKNDMQRAHLLHNKSWKVDIQSPDAYVLPSG
jgi:hypothetical protein